MRFCNESANIGTFWELPTKVFKIFPCKLNLGVRAVFAAAPTAIATFEMVLGGKNHQSLFIKIIVF
jgi:hypothetical protein